jgi:hypothetical protein
MSPFKKAVETRLPWEPIRRGQRPVCGKRETFTGDNWALFAISMSLSVQQPNIY